ncbi:MAG: sigma-70 factor domain-containing protein, partial [Thermoguttaceae bacterium]
MAKTTRRRQTASVQSPLETYLREINETSLLSADDEHELAIAIGAGDNQARDRMVRANLRLVVNIARGYTGKGLSLQDLIEEGNLGLL